ncbi:ribosome biogenesis GTPase YlqF [Alicyclobacillus cycloheptanicus]|nr:ribosome biogenesis GTPase YlqF [Alicyclobacillus cycloheptanicus]
MAKARREMTESLKRVDAVLELVDARLPLASANPMLAEISGTKPRTVVMTRTDLADPAQTERWVRYFREQGLQIVGIDARTGHGVRDVIPALERATTAKRERDAKRGIRPRAVRAMVVGIPNVGKSSLINRLAGRAATKTGDRPGITKQQQWIRLGNVELLDTPGVLWPKLDDEAGAFALAMSGAVKAEVIDLPAVCAYFIVWCSKHYPGVLEARYTLDPLPEMEASAEEAWNVAAPVLEAIAKRRGLMRAGGVHDTERAAELVLRELQTGQLGRLTFEWAPGGVGTEYINL